MIGILLYQNTGIEQVFEKPAGMSRVPSDF